MVRCLRTERWSPLPFGRSRVSLDCRDRGDKFQPDASLPDGSSVPRRVLALHPFPLNSLTNTLAAATGRVGDGCVVGLSGCSLTGSSAACPARGCGTLLCSPRAAAARRPRLLRSTRALRCIIINSIMILSTRAK